MATTLKGTILGGVIFSANPATINIPSGSIDIVSDEQYSDGYLYGSKSFTVPNNIRVIRIYFYAASVRVYPDNSFKGSLKSGNRWLLSNIGGSDPLNIYRDIGVTPGKTYTLTGYLEGKISSCGIDGSIYLEYSPSINNETPDFTDY